ncbi:hypothetical protein CRUP_010591 [Coryphaenoides rupestris]|nr:hypothetical protein CRUP_010591 [Coryphaenoides rupestris]
MKTYKPQRLQAYLEGQNAADEEQDDEDEAEAAQRRHFLFLINAVVLVILFTALSDPEQYHLTSAELANDLDDSEEPEKEQVPVAPVVIKKKQQHQKPTQEKAPAVQPAKTAAPPELPTRSPSEAEPSAKQNPAPAAAPAQQKKLEEVQAPKPVKKKKARRET